MVPSMPLEISNPKASKRKKRTTSTMTRIVNSIPQIDGFFSSPLLFKIITSISELYSEMY